MSSIISSKIEELNRLHIEPFPTKPKRGLSIVRVERTLIAVDPQKPYLIYSTGVQNGFAYQGFSKSIESTLIGLEKLNVLSKDALKQYQEQSEKYHSIREKKWSSQSILDNAKSAGLVLSPKQRLALENNAKEQGK